MPLPLTKARSRLLVAFAGVVALASGPPAGMDPAIPAYRPAAFDFSGGLHSIGSDAMESLTKRWIEIYRRGHPGVTFTVEIEKAWNAIPGLSDGRAQFAPLGRLPNKEEYLTFIEKTGYPPFGVVVANCTYSNKDWPHPHGVFVHKDNPLTKLTLTQVDAIFSKTRRRGFATDITTWGQLGLTGEWADKPIVLYGIGMTKVKGPANYFRERALASGDLKDTLNTVPTEDLLVPKVAGDRYGIGFTGLPYETADVKHLAIAEKEGARYSDASLADVAAGKYPLSRVIYIHVNRAPGMPLDPPVKELLRVALSREGQAAAVAEGYLPLTAKEVAAELARLE